MIHSFTSITKFELCALQFAHVYVWKDLPREPPSAPMLYGQQAHSAFEVRLKDRVPLIEPWKSFEPYCASLDSYKPLVEASLAIDAAWRPVDFWANEAMLRGKIDVAVPTERAVILDWKTGKKREDPDELEIFAVLLRSNFPLVKHVQGYYVWLKEGRIGQMHELSKTEEKFQSLRERIGQVEAAIAAEFFPPKESWACGFCPVKDCRFNRRVA